MNDRTVTQIVNSESTLISGLRFNFESEHIADGEIELANDLKAMVQLTQSGEDQRAELQGLYAKAVSLGPNLLAARYLDLLVKVVERDQQAQSENNNPIA